ncbi:hypothetical protein [Corynebacterium sp.]|uniref:hypothetical protein n=1 Tax=Corynebacterium sp. TaxID=1720 RepID=UPI0026DA8C64|nr:hypothetical protein [Corynebacterium sp.]MDO4610957.1 hypothetical protein [Corynebacterium sp.]
MATPGKNSDQGEFDDLREIERRLEESERASYVRGRLQHEWWDEVKRLQREGDFAGMEALLVEMRDAAERSSAIMGSAIPFAPTQALLALHKVRGDDAAALAEVDRYITATMETVIIDPEGGNTGLARALEWWAVLEGTVSGDGDEVGE